MIFNGCNLAHNQTVTAMPENSAKEASKFCFMICCGVKSKEYFKISAQYIYKIKTSRSPTVNKKKR
jgi:hypothetical protein